MAQYHFAATLVARSKGQSAVAAAAYRAGMRLDDERLGKTFDYTRRRGVLHTEILAPDNAPDWMRDRGQLWNAVEKAEKRKDSQLARSLDIALPHELTPEQNLDLVREFVRAEFVVRGMIADVAIHAPGRRGDDRNVHAHILLTTREIAGPGFGSKARDWNSKQELQEWRKAWADHANRILEREGFEERIDHRSLSDQGIDREPTTHIGPAGKEMEERGEASDRAKRNRDIKAANDDMECAARAIIESEERLAELKRQLVVERMGKIGQTVSAADSIWKEAERRWAPAPNRVTELEPSAPAKQPERTTEPAPPAPQPEPPAIQPEPPAQTSRRRTPSRYADLIDRQKYTERSKEEEQKQDTDRQNVTHEKEERERKPDRER
jgi:hypothetical protein